MDATGYNVTLASREGIRTLTADSEREVALMAESVLRRYVGDVLALGFSVHCAEAAAAQRIADYLSDVALEMQFA